jgi:DNA repair protein SbcC/Rad50
MRLMALSINGFRGFSTAQEFDLEGDAVILVGANGSGKTSFFDALLWGLAGKVPRLGDDGKAVVSQYSTSGEARVELALTTSDGSTLKVVRRFDGAMNLSVEVDDEPLLRGPSAQARLLEELWPDARLASDPWEALSRALTRGVYLQQDLLREFIEADGDQGRFTVIGEIVGAGRVGELQRQLESGKASWTRATNALASEVEPVRGRRSSLAQRLSRLSEISAEGESLPAEWQHWIQALQGFLEVSEVSADSPDAARLLDATLKQLEALELQSARRVASLGQLVRHLEARPHDAEDLEPIRQALAEAEEAAARSRVRLQAAQQEAAAERSRLVALREQAEELRALAQLALRHLDEHCPVCEQLYDVQATRARLQGVVAGDSMEPAPSSADLERLSADVERDERVVSETALRLRGAERANAEWEEWQKTFKQLVSAEHALTDEADLPARAAELYQTLSQQQ